jgi:hypothetical protein
MYNTIREMQKMAFVYSTDDGRFYFKISPFGIAKGMLICYFSNRREPRSVHTLFCMYIR